MLDVVGLDTPRLPIGMPFGNVFQSSIRFGETDVMHANGAYRSGTVAGHQHNHHISNRPTSYNWRISLSRGSPLLPALPVRFLPLVQQTASYTGTDPFVEAGHVVHYMLNPYPEVAERLAYILGEHLVQDQAVEVNRVGLEQ